MIILPTLSTLEFFTIIAFALLTFSMIKEIKLGLLFLVLIIITLIAGFPLFIINLGVILLIIGIVLYFLSDFIVAISIVISIILIIIIVLHLL
ncbi:hypothetical protein YN1_5470 [Nanoarchaeota archaeon]